MNRIPKSGYQIYFQPSILTQGLFPESAALQNGDYTLTVRAVDADGNSAVMDFKANVDVMSAEDMRFDDPYYTSQSSRGGGKNSIHFSGTFKENSMLSVIIDGKTWLGNYSMGPYRYYDNYLETTNSLSEGEHDLVVRTFRDGLQKEKKG